LIKRGTELLAAPEVLFCAIAQPETTNKTKETRTTLRSNRFFIPDRSKLILLWSISLGMADSSRALPEIPNALQAMGLA
jgi:hypothetical protein